MAKGITVRAKHIPGVENVRADLKMQTRSQRLEDESQSISTNFQLVETTVSGFLCSNTQRAVTSVLSQTQEWLHVYRRLGWGRLIAEFLKSMAQSLLCISSLGSLSFMYGAYLKILMAEVNIATIHSAICDLRPAVSHGCQTQLSDCHEMSQGRLREYSQASYKCIQLSLSVKYGNALPWTAWYAFKKTQLPVIIMFSFCL